MHISIQAPEKTILIFKYLLSRQHAPLSDILTREARCQYYSSLATIQSRASERVCTGGEGGGGGNVPDAKITWQRLLPLWLQRGRDGKRVWQEQSGNIRAATLNTEEGTWCLNAGERPAQSRKGIHTPLHQLPSLTSSHAYLKEEWQVASTVNLPYPLGSAVDGRAWHGRGCCSWSPCLPLPPNEAGQRPHQSGNHTGSTATPLLPQ